MTTLTELVEAVRDMADQHEEYIRWADAWLADSTTAGPPPHFAAFWAAESRSGLSAQGAANDVGLAVVTAAAADAAVEAAKRCEAAGNMPLASGMRKKANEHAATRDACVAAAQKTLAVCA